MVEQPVQGCGIRRRVDRLQRETDIAAHNLERRAVDPRRLHADTAPELVQPPEIGRQPGEAAFQHHHLQLRMPCEHALDDQAGELGLERLRLRDIVLDVIGSPADRGGRVVIGGTGMNADRQAQPFGRGVDRPVGTLAEWDVAHHEHQHLYEAAIARAALDLGDRFFHALRRDHDRAPQPRVAIEPFLGEPIVQRPAERILHVLAEHHLHAEQRIEDAMGDLERIERLPLQVVEARSRLTLRGTPVRPRGDRRIERIGLRHEIRHAARGDLVAPVIVEIGQQACEMRNGRMQVAIHAARDR